MALHKEFATAGKSPGLQVWRVEKMDLKPVPREFYGEFYTGDSYILLYTTSTPSYNVHTWIGEKSSLDEKAAAPIFMIQLDDFLNGKPVQYTEFQNDESVTFMSYFKAGIQYKQGGVSTGLKHAQSVEVKRLLHLKGRSSVRATEVDMSWGSFNQGDCFIIDLGENIFIWAGSKSNPFERLKSIDLAIEIRNNERAGKAVIHHIDEGSEPDVVLDLLGPMPNIPPGTSDKLPDKKNIPPTLYLISDAAGSMKTTKMADKPPFQQDALSNSDCYILDNAGDRKIFVWKGKDANPDERKAALTAANKFIKDKNYSPKTKVQIMPSGAENALFKHFFFNWIDKYETTGPSEAYTMGRIAQVPRIPFDSSTLHNNTAMAAQHGMVDDGSGDVKIYRVEDGDTVPVDPSTYGQFFGGDCYLVQYSYSTGARMRHIIYTWQGQKCSRDELTASAFLTVRMDDSMDKAAVQVRVTQGQEPAHLVSLFKNKPLVIHLGGTSRASGESKPASTRLYHIRQSCTKATRAVEVEPSASSLNTNDVFVLKTPKALMLWVGKGGTPEEKEAAKYVAGMLGGTATEVQETKEPVGFWNALGGKKDYQTSKTLQESVKAPRLFNCSNKTGRLIAEEVPGEFTQLDLATDDVMILDTYDQIFAWVGKDANETEKTGSLKIAQEYLDSDPSGRSSIPVTKMKQGEELLSFTGWFHAWDPKMWDKDILQRINDRLKE
ncbi:putative adseverin-like [Scophthalmus maximus]|uniref:Putative adseverin-like n=1 Tax=Scophthalmus maximus TaxID=52904 RepID=A0A2U9C5P5_SCOMX|nr:scinderin like a [Scophthalmus maximus]AWP11483.1 putative adseverin-like [Scophthalmus maximus]